MRQGEVFGLAVDDIDLNAGWLHIQRQVKLSPARVRSAQEQPGPARTATRISR
jgi:integrase